MKYSTQSPGYVCSLALCLCRTNGVSESTQKREGNVALIGTNEGEKDIRNKCKARMQSKDDITVTQGTRSQRCKVLRALLSTIEHDTNNKASAATVAARKESSREAAQ